MTQRDTRREQEPRNAQRKAKRRPASRPRVRKTPIGRKYNVRRWEAQERAALRERVRIWKEQGRRDLPDPATGTPRCIQDPMATGEYDPINSKHRLSLNKYQRGNRSHHPPPGWKRGQWVLGQLKRSNARPTGEGYDYTHAWPERAADHARTALDRSRDESLPPSPPPERLPEIVNRGVGTGASGRQAAA
jgi:hypothetical protein